MNGDKSIRVDLNRCDKCGTCISVCPENAISLIDEIVIDGNKCVRCLRCVNICPFAAIDAEDISHTA